MGRSGEAFLSFLFYSTFWSFLLLCFAFPLSRLLRNEKVFQIFRLNIFLHRDCHQRIWWQTVVVFFFNNFAPFSKSQIITSRVGGFFFFFFSNGCKSPAHVIKDADINILVCKLIPSAQLWGRGSVTEVRQRQCAVCAASSERLICYLHLVQIVAAWRFPWVSRSGSVFLLLRLIYWLPSRFKVGPRFDC